MYPVLNIHTNKVFENTQKVLERTKEFNLTVTAITKCLAGNYGLAKAYADAGVNALGDSNINNIKNYESLDIDKWLIRIPAISEAEETVKYTTLSLNSEVAVVEALNAAAEKQDKIHQILVMLDLGDLREGHFYDDTLFYDVEKMLQCKNIEIKGVGTNLTCYGAIIPTLPTYERFARVQDEFLEKFGLKCEIASGGNSSTYYMVEDKTLPDCITNLRLGEILLFGQEAAYQEQYDYLHHDAFILEAEVVEVKEKPSLPVGKPGRDAFGSERTFEDRGVRKRVICALGEQDTSVPDLTPIDKSTIILGGSSNHTLIDVSDSDHDYKVGDIVSFRCNYRATMQCANSKHCEIKVI